MSDIRFTDEEEKLMADFKRQSASNIGMFFGAVITPIVALGGIGVLHHDTLALEMALVFCLMFTGWVVVRSTMRIHLYKSIFAKVQAAQRGESGVTTA